MATLVNAISFGKDVSLKDLKHAIANVDQSLAMASKLLNLVNEADTLTHSERKAMTKAVIFVLNNARNELDTDAHGGIPF